MDVGRWQGVRDNQLVGYGLVVGLNKTGDRRQTIFSTQSLVSMLDRMGVTLASNDIRVENIAAVMVTATLSPFARAGSRIDITVSSIGDARSLQGGILVQTPLKAANGETYAVGQGPVAIGGFTAGDALNGLQINHPTVGKVVNGAIVEPGRAQRLDIRGADAVGTLRQPHRVLQHRPVRRAEIEGAKVPHQRRHEFPRRRG